MEKTTSPTRHQPVEIIQERVAAPDANWIDSTQRTLSSPSEHYGLFDYLEWEAFVDVFEKLFA